MRRGPRGIVVAAAGALAMAGSGCAQKKLAECNALVQVINSGVVSIEKTPRNEADPTGVSDLKAMAEAMDKIAGEAAGVQITVPELKRLRDDYQKMAKEIARAERELAGATQDRDKRTAAEAALDAAVKLEDPLVDQINKVCLSP